MFAKTLKLDNSLEKKILKCLQSDILRLTVFVIIPLPTLNEEYNDQLKLTEQKTSN